MQSLIDYFGATSIFGYSIPTFLLLKLVALVVLAAVVNFIYTLKTGRSLTDDRNQLLQQEQRAAGQSKQATKGP